MVAAAVELLALFFLACLRSSAATVQLVSHALAPLWTADRHAALSWADCSHVLWLMLNAFSEAFSVSLNRFFWPPWERFSLLKFAKRQQNVTAIHCIR